MHPRCRQAPPWLARPFSEVHCQSRGPGGYPGRTDRRQGHALRAPDSELTTSVPVPSMRVPPHWASSEEAVMQYARIQVLPDIPPGGVCAGIDWASKDHVACVVDMAGRVTDRFSAAHDKAGIAGMIARLRRSGAAEVAIERSDGVLVGALLAAGLTVVVITSRQVRNLRSRYGAAGGKDDRFDSYVLADTLRTDRARLRPLAADTPATIALRSAVRARKDLVAHRVAAANQLRAHLAVAFPAAVGLFSELDSVLSLAFLARFGSQDAAAGLDENAIAGWLNSLPARGNPAPPGVLCARLRSAPPGATGGHGAAQAGVTAALAAALAGLAAQIKALETQIAGQLAAHPDSHIFTSLPRAGTLRAARLLAEIGDCRSRFPDPWSLAALAGTAAITAALRARAAGLYPDEAGAELLIAHGGLLDRDDFGAFMHAGTSITDGTTPMAWIDWDAAAAAQLPLSGGERRILQLAASIPGLDDRTLQLVITAIRHAAGHRPGRL